MNKNDNNVFEKVLEVDTWIGKRPWTKPAKTEANEKKNNMKKHEHENYKTWWKKGKTKTNMEKHIFNSSSL